MTQMTQDRQDSPRIFPPHPPLRLTGLTVWDSGRTVDLLLPASGGWEEGQGRDQNQEVHLDCSGLTVAPGFRDPHVHFRDPGQTEKEDMVTGSRAAAHGGYTGVLIMPNTLPALDGAPVPGGCQGCRSSLDYLDSYSKINSCSLPVRYALCVAASLGRQGQEPSRMEDWASGLAFPSHPVIAISDDGATVPTALVDQVATMALEAGIPFIDHCEHHESGVLNEGPVARRLGLPGIPESTEIAVVSRDIDLVRRTGVRLHLQHISTAASCAAIRQAKDEGLPVTCETAPHYLALDDKAVEDYGPAAKMNPPLRSSKDRQAVIQAVADGTVDMLATDHAPHTAEQKAAGLAAAPNGVIGLESAYGVAYHCLVAPGIISHRRLIELMSVNPARLMKDQVFEIKAHLSGSVVDLRSSVDLKSGQGPESEDVWGQGQPDLVLLKTGEETRIQTDRWLSKARNTPFQGWTVESRVVATILGGRISCAQADSLRWEE